MVPILCVLLVSIFGVLAAVHFYWALGGDWGFARSLPAAENGMRVLSSTKLESAIVGLGLRVILFDKIRIDKYSLIPLDRAVG